MKKKTHRGKYLRLKGHGASMWLTILFTAISFQSYSQNIPMLKLISNDQYIGNRHNYVPNDSLSIQQGDTILLLLNSTCKSQQSLRYALNNTARGLALITKDTNGLTHAPFLTLHGNVQYDFLYRSFVDTPFSQNGYQQHTVQTSLNIVVKDKYPINARFTTRKSNSPFFKDFVDVNTQFDRLAYERKLKNAAIQRIEAAKLQNPNLKAIEEAIKQAQDKFHALSVFLRSPDVLQKIIEERERLYYEKVKANAVRQTQHIPTSDSLRKLLAIPQFKMGPAEGAAQIKKPQADSAYTQFIQTQKKELDSLQQTISKLQGKSDSLKNRMQKEIADVRKQVYRARNFRELQRAKLENGLNEKTSGTEAFLSNIKSVGIGRSMLNYTELTAWNVSLTGLNATYNSNVYAAIAAGKIDYGFRDFFGKNTRQKGQNLLMGRIGWGDVERKALIFTGFTGRKLSYGSLLNDSATHGVNVVGYSIEGILKKNAFTSLSAEVAKTTKPIAGSIGTANGFKSLSDFSDHSNLGVNLKGETILQQTDTRISGFYRKTGESYQSFSLFTYNTDQTAWLLKLDQPFLKNMIGLIAMLRRNDFTNPFTEKTFKTSTVFKTIQLNVRIPKWPMVSAGYYPGSQLYMVDKEKIRENAYYIMNGSLVHSYSAGDMRMLSSLIYNNYSSKGTDSGFIAYKGVSYMASQSFIFSKAQLQSSYTYTNQEQMQFYTLEAGGEYTLGKAIRVGAGGKYNKIAGGKIYLGSRADLGIELKGLGSLQLQYEKSFLPTIYQTLFPVEVGRVSWFKFF